MRHRAKTRIGVAALTVIYSLLAFPLTAHAEPRLGFTGWGGFGEFGNSGACDEDQVHNGGSWGSAEGDYTKEDDHGYYALRTPLTTVGASGNANDGAIFLCGEMSRQPSDDPILGAAGAACQSWDEGPDAISDWEDPIPTGSNGFGRIYLEYSDWPYLLLSDVGMVFTPGGGMLFKGEYTSAPDMPDASTGTAYIYISVSTLYLYGCNYSELPSNYAISGGSVTLIPDEE